MQMRKDGPPREKSNTKPHRTARTVLVGGKPAARKTQDPPLRNANAQGWATQRKIKYKTSPNRTYGAGGRETGSKKNPRPTLAKNKCATMGHPEKNQIQNLTEPHVRCW